MQLKFKDLLKVHDLENKNTVCSLKCQTTLIKCIEKKNKFQNHELKWKEASVILVSWHSLNSVRKAWSYQCCKSSNFDLLQLEREICCIRKRSVSWKCRWRLY